MQKLTNSIATLALYKYGETDFGGAQFGVFYPAFLDVLARAGLKPAYVGIDGIGYKGGFTKVGGKSHKKMLESDFSGVTTLSLAVTPQESTEPAYDSFASISVSFVGETGEVLFYFAIDEAFLPFSSEAFDSVLHRLARLHGWSFGYAFKAPASRNPEFYILGLDPGNLAAEDRKALIAWYASSPQDRLKHIRNVYSVNLLGNSQLAQTLPGGQTLREFIERVPGSKIEMLQDADLVLWRLDSDVVVQSARRNLQQSGMCIELPVAERLDVRE